MIAVYFAHGFEEIEAITTVDVLRRAEINTAMISVEGNLEVEGSHGIKIICNELIEAIDPATLEMLVLPGGMPGASRLEAHPLVIEHIQYLHLNNKPLAAICAAPMILGKIGLLAHKEVTAFPGFEKYLIHAHLSTKKHLVSEGVFTARGAGVAMDFAFDLVEYFKGKEFADALALAMIFTRNI